jgi:hypothetical protein
MSDDDLLAAVRECLTTARDRVAGEQMARPVGDIVARGRQRRLRHGLAATATAVVIAAAVAAPALLPGNGPGPARLAAWTVIAEPGGKLTVTIRELRDPAGLQRRLRADGVSATVRFAGQLPRGCLYYPLSRRQLTRLQARIFPQTSNTSGHTAFTIHTTAVPARIGLWITLSPPSTHATQGDPQSIVFTVMWTFVYATGHCPPGGPVQGASGGGGGVVSGPGK